MLVSENKVIIKENAYDFDIGADTGHPWFTSFKSFIRNLGTVGGQVVAGFGTPYNIFFKGEATINYKPKANVHTHKVFPYY